VGWGACVAVYLPKKREEMEGRAGRQAGGSSSSRPGIGSGGWGSWATLKREKGWPCQPRGLKICRQKIMRPRPVQQHQHMTPLLTCLISPGMIMLAGLHE
jgi:hypothetical protein